MLTRSLDREKDIRQKSTQPVERPAFSSRRMHQLMERHLLLVTRVADTGLDVTDLCPRVRSAHGDFCTAAIDKRKS